MLKHDGPENSQHATDLKPATTWLQMAMFMTMPPTDSPSLASHMCLVSDRRPESVWGWRIPHMGFR
jgi:hypothetical protein